MARGIKEPLRMLELGGQAVPDELRRTLETMYEWLLAITTPLGYSSSISMVYHDH